MKVRLSGTFHVTDADGNGLDLDEQGLDQLHARIEAALMTIDDGPQVGVEIVNPEIKLTEDTN